jgi:hypothetical protein
MKASAHMSFVVLIFLAGALLTGSTVIGSPARVLQARYVWEHHAVNPYQVLRDVWGSSPTDVFVAGDDGTIIRCDGKACRPQVSGTFENLYAVWGASPTDVYAVGNRGTIVHFDRGHWQSVAPSIASGCDFRAVWGSSPSDVYVAGAEGAMTAIEGGSVMPSAGVIFHYDGTRWLRQQTMAPITTVTAVWGRSRRDVYAGTAAGAVLHSDGSTWGLVAQAPVGIWGPLLDVQALWATSPKDLYVAGTYSYERTAEGDGNSGTKVTVGVLLHYGGKEWRPELEGLEGQPGPGPVWINSAEDVYAVGPGATLLHFDGSDWEVCAAPLPTPLHRIWVAPTGEVVEIGPLGVILWGHRRE